jgi:Ser/Thr protein kinase RdoA (MazF antagonist)
MIEAAQHAAARFDVTGEPVATIPVGGGNVNDTFVVHFRTSSAETRVILQCVNHRVFKDPEALLTNMHQVTTHIHARLARERAAHDRIWQLPRIIPTVDGRRLYKDERGRYWRALSMIESATAHETVLDEIHAGEVGRILGQFHRLLADFDAAVLTDPLPGFHITPGYLSRYDRTRQCKTAQARLGAPEAIRAQAFVDARREFCTVLEDARAEGVLRDRVIHGDPKVANFMIDNFTGKGTGIIDLDTVKPGLIHYDVGDALRSLCNPAGEETRALSQVRFDTDLCRAFFRGYLVDAIGFLTPNDRRYLYEAIRLLALELGLRFFEDYLAGNVYFKAFSAEHNLHRALVQFTLCERIESARAEINDIIREELLHAEATI